MVEGSGEIREMAARIRAHDWESTSLGAIATWPQSLRTAVDILLAMPGPAAILWGPASVQLYNDAYVTIAKDRHPALLGRPVAEGWPEAYETLIAPLLYAARAGHATRLSDVSVMLHGADGRTTERVFDTDWSPIRDETGEVAGALQTLIEITERKRAEANGTLLAEIANDLSRLSAPDEIINAVGVRLAEALNLNLCLFVDVDEERDEVTVHHSWERDGLPSLKQTFRIGDFLTEEFARSQRAGETFVVRDTVTDERTDAEAYTPLSVASILAVPFHRRGRWVAYLAVTDASSRDWRVDEIEVVQEVAERVFGRIERARAEAALRESEERFRALATAGAFLIYRMSPDWTQMRQMLGRDFLADTSAPSETWADGYLLPEDRPEIFAAIEEAIRTKSLFELEHRVRQANGDVGWVLSRAVPIFSADGKIAEWFGAASDITDRKRSETALRESNERLNALFDVTPAGIAIADASGKILRFNKALMRIWGTPPIPESSLDYGAWKGRFADSGEPLRAEDWAMARALSTGEVVLGDVVDIERFDGSLATIINAAAPLRDEAGHITGGVVAEIDITKQRRAEAALRESQERQAFLLKLGDALRLLADPIEVMAAASEALGRRLNAGRCGYGEVDESGEFLIVARDWTDGVMPSFVGRHLFAGFGPKLVERYRSGRSVFIDDALVDARAAGHEAAFEAAGGVRASLGLPLIKDGRFVAGLFVQQRLPRQWTAQEEALSWDVAERTWAAVERARAEAELQKSEDRFAQFAASSSDALWIRDAETLAMEYTSPAIQTIYGISPDGLLGDMTRWVALIVPEDRDTAVAHIKQAQAGAAVVHEFRIRRPSDGEERWIRNTDFPLRDANGRVQRIGGLAEDMTEARHLRERQAVLIAELQHRTRNLMGVVRAMADKTLARSADLPDFRAHFTDRLAALARVQGLLSRLAEGQRITFDELIESEIATLDGETSRVKLNGPKRIALRSSTVQTFALAIHELVTNAVKYGALAQAQAHLEIRWHIEAGGEDGRPWLKVDWRESGVKMPGGGTQAQGGGFGRELIERALPYQLGARTTFVLGSDGVHCTIAMPVSERNRLTGKVDA